MDLLKGAIDVHIHADPSLFPRLMNALEVVKAAKVVGMRGLIFKHHHIPTMDRAYFIHNAVPEVEVYGGITLNYSVGGLNPFAVETALKLGARIIWMPTVDARNHNKHFGTLGKFDSSSNHRKTRLYENARGITIFDENGRLYQSVELILDLISASNAALATSHLSTEESKVLIQEAHNRGVEKIIVTHVNFVTSALSVSDQKWMAEKGAFLEICYNSISPFWRCESIDNIVNNIREVGAKHYILSSDLGQARNIPPTEGLRNYINLLLERDFEPEELRIMVKDNPERILGLTD